MTTIISSPYQIGMVMDVDHEHSLEELTSFFPEVDIILAEGFKRAKRPKIEIFRPELRKEPLCKGDDFLIALVCNADVDYSVPRFSSGDIKGLADFLTKHFNLIPVISADRRGAAI